MPELTDFTYIRALAKRHGFTFSKGLGQNFLTDPEVCPEIARLGIPDGECGVLEIGTGFGVLTRELARSGNPVTAVEIDQRLAPVLKETLADADNVRIVWQDFMELNLPEFFAEQFGTRRVAVCANLPYYITSPILMHLLESGADPACVTVMVQKEAALRLCARLGTRAAGAVTAAVQLRGTAEVLFDVPRTAFYPSPNVDSAVIQITPYAEPVCSPEMLQKTMRIVKAGFAQRRKTAANALASGLNTDRAVIEQALEACGQTANVRFEQLDMETVLALSEQLAV